MPPGGEPRSTRWLFRLLLLMAFTGGGVAAAEVATRIIDGYPLLPLRLEPSLSRLRAADPGHGSQLQKWRGDADAVTYVTALPVADGVNRDWFKMRPPDRPIESPDPELEARARKYRGVELSANYEWNWNAVVGGVCRGEYQDLVAFNRFDDLYVFDPADGTELPTFRFLQHAKYPSGLRTNNFGWRGPDIALNKPARAIRIAFVGASTTVSPHAEAYSYPELTAFWLNHWIASRGLDVSIDVINAGREGLTTRSLQAILRQELVPIEPDLVVLHESSNQFWPDDFLPKRVPQGNRAMGLARRGLMSHSALFNRVVFMMRKSSMSGTEPPKPTLTVTWPRGLDEQDPDLGNPHLPIALPQILSDYETMRHTLDDSGGHLALTSFAWLVYPGMVVDPARDADVLTYLNTTFWPFSYAHLRRFLDFRTRVLRKYASSHGLAFIDVASAYPNEPRLFDDAIHMTHAGIRLQAWIAFNGLVPIIERALASHEWPKAASHSLSAHPAFAGRRLVSRPEVLAACTAH